MGNRQSTLLRNAHHEPRDRSATPSHVPSPSPLLGFDFLSHFSLLGDAKGHTTPTAAAPSGPTFSDQAIYLNSSTTAITAAAADGSPDAHRTLTATPPPTAFELPPPNHLNKQLLQYGLAIEDINLTTALRRANNIPPSASASGCGGAPRRGGRAGGGIPSGRPHGRDVEGGGAVADGGGGWQVAVEAPDVVAAEPAGSFRGASAGPTLSLGPPLLTDEEAAPSACGELLLPPPSGGDPRCGVLLLGAVRTGEGSDGPGAGATGSAFRAEWDIPLSGGSFTDTSANEPCGCNVRVVSPLFGVPQGPPGGQGGAAGGTEQLSQWRLCWSLFDHDASRVSLYLLHSPQPYTHSYIQSPTAAVRGPNASLGGDVVCCEEEWWLTWRLEVVGLDSSGGVVKKVAVPGELSHLFRPRQRGWGVRALLSAAELDELLGAAVLRVVATLVHLPMAAAEVLGTDSAPPGYLARRAAAAGAAGVQDGNQGQGCVVVPVGVQGGVREEQGGEAMDTCEGGGWRQGGGEAEGGGRGEGSGGGVAGRLGTVVPVPRFLAVADCEVLLASLSPRVVLVDGFLPPALCDALRAVAEPRLIRSRVSTGAETPSRVSRSTFFTGESARLPEVVAVEARIQQLMERLEVTGGGRPTLVKSEALQVVSYDVGGFYSEHYDNKAGGVIHRAATIIVYLEDTEEGGATFFPKSTGLPALDGLRVVPSLAALPQFTQQLHAMRVARPGLRIYPAKGRAVVFWSRLPDGTEDLASLHSAEPVRTGSKWICTRWFKELVPA